MAICTISVVLSSFSPLLFLSNFIIHGSDTMFAGCVIYNSSGIPLTSAINLVRRARKRPFFEDAVFICALFVCICGGVFLFMRGDFEF